MPSPKRRSQVHRQVKTTKRKRRGVYIERYEALRALVKSYLTSSLQAKSHEDALTVLKLMLKLMQEVTLLDAEYADTLRPEEFYKNLSDMATLGVELMRVWGIDYDELSSRA